MNSIQLMIDEHKNIKRMLEVIRKASFRMMKGDEINYDDFHEMIDFVRTYADLHHHGKEEKFLFKEMIEHLGSIGNKLITHGMLVEHDFGRLFISELVAALDRVKDGHEESKLDVIANAVGYANHLHRHIEKEDSLIFKYAEDNLAPEILNEVNHLTVKFEEEAGRNSVQTKYLSMLERLESKYLVQ